MAFIGDAFRTKRHDTKPFRDVLEIESPPGSGTFVPMDLTNFTVRFLVADGDLNPLFAGTAVIEDAINGQVSYTPTTGQMALAGFTTADYPLALAAEWELVDGSGVIQTVPEGKDYRKIIVGLDLEAA